MDSLVGRMSDKVAERSSRRGFLKIVVKGSAVGTALLLGLGVSTANAYCGTCPSPCCDYDTCNFPDHPGNPMCCVNGSVYYFITPCLLSNNSLDCYTITGPYGGACPQLPTH